LEWLGQIKLLMVLATLSVDATSLTARTGRRTAMETDRNCPRGNFSSWFADWAVASDGFSLSGGWAWLLGYPSGHLALFSQAVLNKM